MDKTKVRNDVVIGVHEWNNDRKFKIMMRLHKKLGKTTINPENNWCSWGDQVRTTVKTKFVKGRRTCD